MAQEAVTSGMTHTHELFSSGLYCSDNNVFPLYSEVSFRENEVCWCESTGAVPSWQHVFLAESFTFSFPQFLHSEYEIHLKM